MFIRIYCCFLFPFDLYLKSVYLTWAESIFAGKLRFETSWIEFCLYFSVRIYYINWIKYHQKYQNFIQLSYPKFHAAIVSFDFLLIFSGRLRIFLDQLRLFALSKSLSAISIEIWKFDTRNVTRYFGYNIFILSFNMYFRQCFWQDDCYGLNFAEKHKHFPIVTSFIQEQPSTCSSRMNNNLRCSEWKILRY